MKKCHIRTFGCQMNFHDSEKMAGLLKMGGYGFSDDPSGADLIIFNTCSIREKAEQKFFSELGRLKNMKRKNPSLKVAVTGCIAQQMGDEIRKKSPHVDYIIGPQNIRIIGDLAVPRKEPLTALSDDPLLPEEDMPALRKEKSRAWVNIMFGCNNFCSYCIVPYTRGREKSRPPESIINEIEGLAGEGCKEVTLLGQNVNSYRPTGQRETDFPSLLKKINDIEGIKRIRFVTSHPRDLTEELMDCMASLDKVCEHIHLPLQSGSSKMLGLMNRGYTYKDYRGKIKRLRDRIPGIAITTDIIAGFPGEAEADHMDTIRAIKEIEFDGIFAFRYSSRPGTKAVDMDNHLPEDVKLLRLKEILALQDDMTLRKNKPLEGSLSEILVEGESDTDPGKLTGRTRTNKIVNFKGDFPVGEMITVKIIEAKRHSLLGEPIEA